MRECVALVACGVNKNGADDRVISLVDLAPSIEDAINDTLKWLVLAGQRFAERFEDVSKG